MDMAVIGLLAGMGIGFHLGAMFEKLGRTTAGACPEPRGAADAAGRDGEKRHTAEGGAA